MAKVLIIDDEQGICDLLKRIVGRLGHDAVCRGSCEEGLREVLSNPYDVVLLDVQMPDGSGIDLLEDIRGTPSSPEVIIMTGFGSPDGAELAIENGAWDYIQKTSSPKKIMFSLTRVLQYREGLEEAKGPAVALKMRGIVGGSLSMQSCFDEVAQASVSETNVLLVGETGTGKELLARAIHENSPRAVHHFEVVDCAALPAPLVESLLFGHRKGAFTGAEKSREGLIKQAHKGTLFLDEVGELPFSLQKVFLRVLQERRFRPVGGEREVNVDFRLVAATNRSLDEMVAEGTFRGDLLFRLKGQTIHLPPLRERHGDMASLLTYYLTIICQRYGIGVKGFSVEFLETCSNYAWPGNVRELVSCVETAILAARHEPTLFPKHLPKDIRIHAVKESVRKGTVSKGWAGKPFISGNGFPSFGDFRKLAMRELERTYFDDLMAHAGGDVKKARKVSELGRSRFYELLRGYRQSASQ